MYIPQFSFNGKPMNIITSIIMVSQLCSIKSHIAFVARVQAIMIMAN